MDGDVEQKAGRHIEVPKPHALAMAFDVTDRNFGEAERAEAEETLAVILDDCLLHDVSVSLRLHDIDDAEQVRHALNARMLEVAVSTTGYMHEVEGMVLPVSQVMASFGVTPRFGVPDYRITDNPDAADFMRHQNSDARELARV